MRVHLELVDPRAANRVTLSRVAPIRDIERGRSCFQQRQWEEAFEALRRAGSNGPLAREDIDRLVWSAALIGNDDAFLAALERLHQVCVAAEDPRLAARAAFWLGFRLLSLSAPGRATGWLARAQRHLDGAGERCAERGYLLLPVIIRHLGAAENDAAAAVAHEAAAIGELCKDVDLVALTRNLEGRALLRQGRLEPGLALLDEVMIATTSGELSPMVTGIVYCNVIATCGQIYALDRAREWTAALASWCDAQPQLVTFTGECLVHRCEIMQLRGAWPQALEELRKICEHLDKAADQEVHGDAFYQRAELLRLRAELADAETAYRLASRNGREPQPGLALLRLAQGRHADAVRAIDRVLATTSVRWRRASLLPAFIEIMLAAGKLGKALAACDELGEIARVIGTEILSAMAAHARGAIRLADGDAKGAVEPLRHAFAVWHRVEAPYLAARIRVLLSRAFRALGDVDGADLELENARQAFAQLGAAPDLAALDNPAPRSPDHHGLSSRELEVLRLVASGKTNRAIARDLFVSERTIDRHVSNVFSKIDVSTRAAATAFAYENGLV